MKSIRNTRYPLFALILFLGLGLITALFSEASLFRFVEASPFVCPLRHFTGLLCSFCGMTHAWVYFWHGDFARSFVENKLSLPFFFGAPIVLISSLTSDFWTETRVRRGVIVSLVILVAYTLVRNQLVGPTFW